MQQDEADYSKSRKERWRAVDMSVQTWYSALYVADLCFSCISLMCSDTNLIKESMKLPYDGCDLHSQIACVHLVFQVGRITGRLLSSDRSPMDETLSKSECAPC
jgi:hypothetical protein